jgi:hypothetical protein
VVKLRGAIPSFTLSSMKLGRRSCSGDLLIAIGGLVAINNGKVLIPIVEISGVDRLTIYVAIGGG